MPSQECVHAPVEFFELAGVASDQVRSDFRDSGANSPRIGRQVGRTQRANFSVSNNAVVGRDRDDRRVEYGNGLAAGPVIATFAEREVHLIDVDSVDFHNAMVKSVGLYLFVFLRGWVVTVDGKVLNAFLTGGGRLLPSLCRVSAVFG